MSPEIKHSDIRSERYTSLMNSKLSKDAKCDLKKSLGIGSDYIDTDEDKAINKQLDMFNINRLIFARQIVIGLLFFNILA